MVVTIINNDDFVINGDDGCLATAGGLGTVPSHFGSSAFVVLVEPVASHQKHGLPIARYREPRPCEYDHCRNTYQSSIFTYKCFYYNK